MRRTFWFLTILLSALLSAGQSFGVPLERTSSGQSPSYINSSTAPTLANAKALSGQSIRRLSAKTVEPSINPDSGSSPLSTQSSVDKKTRLRINQTYGKLPLQFEANEGQTGEPVKFLARGSGYSMFFTPTESVLMLSF